MWPKLHWLASELGLQKSLSDFFNKKIFVKKWLNVHSGTGKNVNIADF